MGYLDGILGVAAVEHPHTDVLSLFQVDVARHSEGPVVAGLAIALDRVQSLIGNE